ncbi:MAG TPA: hypothetical protein VE175_05585 [Woeseiaceae bacterium]|jgi:hypothetical protein|nr:hypothetical protein [Woeseiaceae bacterium]
MLISLKHNFAFLCNEKCASVSIEAMLRDYSDILLAGPPAFRHTNYRLYARYFAPYLEDTAGGRGIETICLVREPLSRLYSYYRFRSRHQLRGRHNPRHDQSTQGISFPDFVASCMQPEPPPYARIGKQFDFVRNDRNEIGVDRIFLFEHIDEFIRYMSAKVGHKLTIEYRNISPARNRQLGLFALADRAAARARRLLKVAPPANSPCPDPQLPESLLRSFRALMHEDYALYEHASRSRPISMSDASVSRAESAV